MDLGRDNFDAGLLSPAAQAQMQRLEYERGCHVLKGFVVKSGGGITRRPGLERIASVCDNTHPSRLVPFVNGTDRYMLEFSNQIVRVFHDGALVTNPTLPYELASPWTYDEVFALVFAPRGQAIFHPSHDVYELACAGDASWTLTAFASRYGPFLDANEDTTLTITPNGIGGLITLTASKPVFQSGHVGALWELTQLVNEVSLTGEFQNTYQPPFIQNETSAPVTIKGEFDIVLHWHGWGTVQLQRNDGSGWKVVQSWDKTFSFGATDFVYSGEELEDNVEYRFYINWASLGDPDSLYNAAQKWWAQFTDLYPHCHYSLKAKNMKQTGIVRIMAYTSTQQVTALVLNNLGSTEATAEWREGAWSGVRGWPACGTIHESRIYAARTMYQPTGIWAARPFLRRKNARLFYAGSDVTAEDAFARTLDLPETHVIQWLAPLWVLLLGTDGNVAKGIGPSEYAGMDAVNATFIPQAGMGAATTQPVIIGGRVIYVGRGGQRAYEMTYSDDARTYTPEDLTRFADHLTARGISGWAFQQQPYPILWCWFADGTFGGLTRRAGAPQQENLLAWHEHETDGTVECIAVLPGTTEDEVWLEVARTVNGSTQRLVERLKTFDWGTSQRDCFFVDSGYKWDGGAAQTVTGIAVDGITNRVTVTAASHGFSDGWTVRLAAVAGMTDVNGRIYTIADKTAHTFVLKTRDGSGYIDGSAFAAYTSGGTTERVTNQVSGLTWLAAESVSVLLDGQPATGDVTAAGLLSLGLHDHDYYNTIIVGRPYTSAVSPTRPQLWTVTGQVRARKKKLVYGGLELYRTAGGRMGTSAADAQPIDYRQPGDLANADKSLITDTVIQDMPGGWEEEGDLYVETTDPLPMTIHSMVYGIE